jgi:hypothetical protein
MGEGLFSFEIGYFHAATPIRRANRNKGLLEPNCFLSFELVASF